MNLELILKNIWDTRSEDSLDGLENQESSEDFLQQAYQGRFLFELIQNGRDAAKSAGIDGNISIDLQSDCLSISNSGAAFDEKGITGISRIGKSSKGGGGFIGFKGIGFKSIQEVSATPKVVTGFGSILFSKEISFKKMKGKFSNPANIPLFFLPHFDPEQLTKTEIEGGFVSRIDLPLRPEIDHIEIISSFKQITELQVILLGNLHRIEFRNEAFSQTFLIKKRPGRKIDVYKNDLPRRFKLFSPKQAVRIPESLLRRLPSKELELFEKEPFVDISLAFQMDDNDRLLLLQESKLYLYFPLRISSGFSFVIHSLFLVDPQRSALRSALLNEFILECIAEYIGGEWLSEAKKNHQTTYIHFLAFKRNTDEVLLDILYDRLISKLNDQKFIFDSISRRFYNKNEVIIADAVDKNLFPGNMIKGKRLIYLENPTTSDWLRFEMEVEYLHYDDIAENIEEECKRQAKANNLIFFQHLYNYVTENDSLSLAKRRILLTDKWQLYSSEDEVFNGMDNLKDVRLSKNIRKRIHLLHPGLKISEARQVRDRLGFIEYNTEALIRRLLGLYDDPKVNPMDIFDALLSLPVTARLKPTIVRHIRLPVKKRSDSLWVNPLSAPVYFPSPELQILYPDGLFLDLNSMTNVIIAGHEVSEKLSLFGVWKIPALYYSDKSRRVNLGQQLFKTMNSISNLSTAYFEISGDWILDYPGRTNEWFMNSVISNWQKYKEILMDDEFPRLNYRSQHSGKKSLAKENNYDVSSFKETLCSKSWIYIGRQDPEPIKELIGINRTEKGQRTNALNVYFKLFSIEYSQHQNFINDVNLRHLNNNKLKNFESILLLVKKQYETIPTSSETFRKAYNVILNKLFELYNFNASVKAEIKNLKRIPFLCRDEFTKEMFWRPADQIYYIDNRTALDAYPDAVKQVVQPQFTIIDKGRFGQIGRKIGIEFRDKIKERLKPVAIDEEASLMDYIPDLPACLALVENSLEDPDFEHKVIAYLSKMRIRLTKLISLDIYKDEVLIEVFNPPYKVINVDSQTMAYAIPSRREGNEHQYNSELLMAIINEFVDKDVQRVEVTLTDYYFTSDKAGYLFRNGIDADRVTDIAELLQETVYTPRQNFWNQIMKTRPSGADLNWILQNDLDFEVLASLLGLSKDLLADIDDGLDYEVLTAGSNLYPFKRLLELLNWTLADFLALTGLHVSFKSFYMKEFETLKLMLKQSFEKQLFENYKNRPLKEQEKFSNQLLRYDFLKFNADEGDISISIPNQLVQEIRTIVPAFLYPDDSGLVWKGMLSKIYNTNYQQLISKCAEKGIIKESIDNFLLENKFRSLVYFGAVEHLIAKYRQWITEKEKQLNASGGYKSKAQIDLSSFVNLPGTVILNGQTSGIPKREDQQKNDGSKHPGPKRVVGGGNQNNNDITGLVSEKQVYELLKTQYNNVEWISANAAIAGVTPEGNDRYHFDIHYISRDLKTHYVEVKGTSGTDNYFFISSDEVDFARANGDYYHLFFVSRALDNKKREITDLGNPFQIEQSESIFHNRNFTAVFDTLKITFQLTS